MSFSSRSNGIIDTKEGFDIDNLLVGKAPIVCDSAHSTPKSKKSVPKIAKEEDTDFNFAYPTIQDIRKLQNKPMPFEYEFSRPKTARPLSTNKYYKCHETDEVFSRAEAILERYDLINERKRYIMHSEYEAQVVNPLNERMREQLTGRNYRSRQNSRLSGNRDTEPLRINTAGVGDRLTRSRLASRNESRLEKMMSNVPKEKKKAEFEMDPRRKADTRFFGYEKNPRKGTKVFEQKYKSKVEEQIDNFK